MEAIPWAFMLDGPNATNTTTTTTLPPQLDSSIDSVTGAFSINLFLFIALMLTFDVLVHWPRARRYLLPNFQDGDFLPSFLFGWARQVWQERREAKHLNTDAVVFIQFCELGFKFSVCGSILDIGLLPMYYTGSGNAPGFNVFSISNLDDESPRFWGVVVAAYLLVGCFLHFVRAEWQRFVILKREHFVHGSGGRLGPELAQARHSVIVESIPPDARSSEAVKEFFEELFGDGSVHSCMLQQDTVPLYRHLDMQQATKCCGCCSRVTQPLSNVVERVVDGAEELLRHDLQAPHMESIASMGSTNDHASHSVPVGDSRRHSAGVGAVLDLGRGARQLAVGVVQIGQELTVGHGASSTAFVTLNKAFHCAAVEQMLLKHGPFWRASAAPEPRDMIWRNAPKPLTQMNFRIIVSQGLLAFGILFWSAPVAFVQTIAQASSLQKQLPWLVEFLQHSPAIYAVITAYLPAMALIGLQGVLPTLFEFQARKYEGHKSKSEVQIRVLNRCFAYQLASLYVTILSGSVISSFEEILDHPKSILNILSDSLPKVAVYFVTFVLARVGTGLPLLLLRLPAVVFKSEVQFCAFGSELANVALVLVLGLTYSFIAPAILPVCALFFGVSSLVYRWLFAHVYQPEFDSGGMMWYDLFVCVIIGLLLGTLSLVAIAAIKASATQAAILLPLPVIVLVFGAYCSSQFAAQSRRVAVKDAVHVDLGLGPQSLFSSQAYSDPVLHEYHSCANTVVQPGQSSSALSIQPDTSSTDVSIRA